MAPFKSWSAAIVLLVLLISEQSLVLCQDDKRQDLVPFPRIGKRQGLIPFPRIGRSDGQSSVYGAAAGEDTGFGGANAFEDEDSNPEGSVDLGYMLVPDYMKRGPQTPMPRIGRRKRSISHGPLRNIRISGFPAMSRLLPEDLQALFRRTMRQLVPSPRVGRADAFVPRLGKKSIETMGPFGGLGGSALDNDVSEEFMVKRGPSAFTPRIGRAAFTPRIGRSDSSNGQLRTVRTFTPRIGK